MKRLSLLSRRTAPRLPGAVRGFTLIELLVTIAIAVIMTGIAAPSMSRMMNANRIQSAASALQGDMQFARTEAIKRGAWVSLCPSSNGTSCITANTWHSGWIVFSDVNGNGVFGTGDTLLKVRKAMSGGNTIVATPAPTVNAVIFNREGFTSNLGTTQVAFTLHTSDSDAGSTRCVLVGFGGRLTTVSKGSTCS
jgi:type IV fimbrial biogenesis protein FimT